MKIHIYILSFFVFSTYLLAQNSELNSEEYASWRINYTPYKIKAIQAINDYRLLAKDSTLPRSRFQDDIIIIQSRLSGNLEEVWYGNRGKKMTKLSSEKVKAVFSKSFIITILDRNKYYYLNFDAFGDNTGEQKSIDFVNATFWGSTSSNEFSSSPARLSFYIPTSDMHVEFTVGDEYMGFPAWVGGFSRFGFVHPNFKLGLQTANIFEPPYGNPKTLNGGLGAYAALNLESFRIGIAGSFKNKNDFEKTLKDSNNIRYAGLQLYFSYSPLVWNEAWGAGRFWIGLTYVNVSQVRLDAKGNVGRQFTIQRATNDTLFKKLVEDIISPFIRFEYVTPTNEYNYSKLESYVQFAGLAATASVIYNPGKSVGLGVVAHANMFSDKLYAKDYYIFPAIRFRF